MELYISQYTTFLMHNRFRIYYPLLLYWIMESESSTHYFCNKYKWDSDLSTNTFLTSRWWRNLYALAARLLIVRLPYTIDFIFSSPSIFNISTFLGFLTLVSLVSVYMPMLGCTIETNRIKIFFKSHFCIPMNSNTIITLGFSSVFGLT